MASSSPSTTLGVALSLRELENQRATVMNLLMEIMDIFVVFQAALLYVHALNWNDPLAMVLDVGPRACQEEIVEGEKEDRKTHERVGTKDREDEKREKEEEEEERRDEEEEEEEERKDKEEEEEEGGSTRRQTVEETQKYFYTALFSLALLLLRLLVAIATRTFSHFSFHRRTNWLLGIYALLETVWHVLAALLVETRLR